MVGTMEKGGEGKHLTEKQGTINALRIYQYGLHS